MPCAAAVVAVAAPGKPLTVAWAGDSRAYLLHRGIARQLTNDHNLRRVYPPTAIRPYAGNRNVITSFLGSAATDEDRMNRYNHPAIEAVTVPLDSECRLVLASDGAYEPHVDAGNDLYLELADDMPAVARAFVDTAAEHARAAHPPQEHRYVDNATVLVTDVRP